MYTISDEEYILSQLENHKVILKGHFLLSSSRHSNSYINKDAIYCIPRLFQFIVEEITDILRHFDFRYGIKYDVITGPAIAGAVLAVPIALKLNKIFVYPEKTVHSGLADDPNNGVIETKVMKFNRGYDKIIKNRKVVIIEDIITTGGSVQQTIDAIELCGGECVGIVAIWNREGWKPPENIKLVSLINKIVPSWEEKDCPMCKANLLLIDPKTGTLYTKI